MVVNAIFDKIGVVWPLIIDQRLVHLTTHVFPSIDHILGFLVETISWSKIQVLAFGIIENGHSWLFSIKMGVVWPLIID
jgi:hypothetical protein